jgi:hypothetical protein
MKIDKTVLMALVSIGAVTAHEPVQSHDGQRGIHECSIKLVV